MKTVNLLIASSNRRINNLVEAAVHDVCYDQAVVQCIRVSGVDELLRASTCNWLDLIMVAPDALIPAQNRRARVTVEQTAKAIRVLKSQNSTPVLALEVAPENHLALLEAGADNAFAFPVDSEALKTEVRRLLSLAEQAEPAAPGGWSLFLGFLRGALRPKSA